ncbi:MAG: hypothetical protein Q9M91_01430 [Candidatus Dojkabacteria bacterium]|nr:hypothetical protein [Candidatus Dojkabacteria bacterium]
MIKNFIAITLSICLVVIFTAKSVSASDNKIVDYLMEINLREDLTADINVTFSIKNTDKTKVIRGQEIVLPFANINAVTSFIDGTAITNKVTTIGKSSKIEIDFSNDPIKINQQKLVRISINASNLINEFGGIKYMIVYGGFSGQSSTSNLKLTYPLSLGEASYISSSGNSVTTNNNGEIETSLNDLTLLSWGNEYSLDVSSLFKPEASNESSSYLFSLPRDTRSSSVEYSSVFGTNNGVSDDLDNLYLVGNTKDQVSVGFNARIHKFFASLPIIKNDKYNFKFNSSSELGKEILSTTNNFGTDNQKLKALDQLFLTRSNLDESNILSLEEIEDTIWDKNLNGSFNSFEFCYIYTAYAEVLGYKSRIIYGYSSLPKFSGSPHFWCQFQNEEENFIIDTYLSFKLDLDFFGIENDFDKIEFGTWHPSLDHNNALGLLGSNNNLQNLTQAVNLQIPSKERSISLDKLFCSR